MKKRTDINYEKIEELLLNKNYGQLSVHEKKLAYEAIGSEAEYAAMRAQLLCAKNAISHEQPGLEPDPAIRVRLLNAMALKPATGKVLKSSFADVLLSLFSPQNIGLKTAMAALLVAGSLWFGNPGSDSPDALSRDSIRQYADTSFKANKDTSLVRTVLFIH